MKTGRYSHAKRTQDTLEVKRLHSEQTESCWHGRAAWPASVVPDRQPDIDQGLHGDSLEVDASTQALIQCLKSAFEQSFGQTSVMYKEPAKIEALIRDTLLRYGAESVDYLMFGDPSERTRLLEIRDEACHTLQVPMSSFDASSCEGFPSGVRTTSMMKFYIEELEIIIRSIVSFAKCIPGYTSLKMHDQVTLIKASRTEVIHLIKYKHMDRKLSCIVNYDLTKEVVTLMPLSVWHRIWQDDEFYRQCWGNAMRLQQLDLSVSEVALLAAIVLMSPDREHLLEPERVHAIQETLVAALRCSIAVRRSRGNLPDANRFLARLLLQLPLLRTHSHQSQLLAQKVQQRYPFGVPPLVQECLAVQQPEVRC